MWRRGEGRQARAEAAGSVPALNPTNRSPAQLTPSPLDVRVRRAMARKVQCVRLGEEAEGLERPPFKGELGQRIFDNVSQQAWRGWIEHSKMLINEFRLDLTSEQGQRLWMTECEKYFFGDGSATPPDFKQQ